MRNHIIDGAHDLNLRPLPIADKALLRGAKLALLGLDFNRRAVAGEVYDDVGKAEPLAVRVDDSAVKGLVGRNDLGMVRIGPALGCGISHSGGFEVPHCQRRLYAALGFLGFAVVAARAWAVSQSAGGSALDGGGFFD